jgi:hypothetical protein
MNEHDQYTDIPQIEPAFKLSHLYVLAGIVGTVLTLAAVWLLVMK